MTRFLKGHGTENDFILLPDFADLDPLAEVPALTAEQVRRLCDRHAGIGADGVLRVLPVGTATESEGFDTGEARWFMDYRNADGSMSEMCGNGARLFARYLIEAGLESGTTFDLATRGGVRRVSLGDSGQMCIDMGPATPGAQSMARVGDQDFSGRQVSMTNPHLVCVTDIDVDELDLSAAPIVDGTLFPDGVNVEFVNVLDAGVLDAGVLDAGVLDAGEAPHVRMRVHERGVGETRSCGTGACAVGAQALAGVGRERGNVIVDVPGGQVRVSVTPETTVLCGPAVFVASGEINSDWWASTSG